MLLYGFRSFFLPKTDLKIIRFCGYTISDKTFQAVQQRHQ